ncbi:MAG: hypothetical protein AB1427_04060 [Thermodesulfobacteriota bacterium]
MKPVSRNEIIERMEKLQPGERLTFQLTPTFSSQFVILELNPAFPGKGEKKYLLRVGKTEERARTDKPYNSSDKAKKLAEWVAERWPQWVVDTTPPQAKAA